MERTALHFRTALATLLLAGSAAAETVQDFDSPGTAYTPAQCAGAAPAVLPGGPTGNFLRLASTQTPNSTTIAFPLTDPGAASVIVASFDFRLTPQNGRADGLGFVFLNTAASPSGGACPALAPFVPEEPNFAGSVGIGFDIFKSADELNNNHVSIHYDGVKLHEFDAPPTVNLASGQWINARIVLRQRVPPAMPDITVILTPRGGESAMAVDRFHLPEFAPYQSRILLGARSGGFSAHHDIDNVRAQFVNDNAAILSFAGHAQTLETGSAAVVTVTRSGNTASSVQVPYSTSNGSASAGQDYAAASGTLTFGPNETAKSFTIPIVDDSSEEGDESFQVILGNPIGGAILAGPSAAMVTIADDERARRVGSWSRVFSTEIVAIHLHHLPDGTLMYWGSDDGESGGTGHAFDPPRIYNPESGAITHVDAPHNVFCSGHSFLADGSLFVAGGHETLTGQARIRRGLPVASRYDPFSRTWHHGVPNMNAGRWYPTVTTLADGRALAVSGEDLGPGVNDVPPATINDIPQVWSPATNAWQTLDRSFYINRAFTWPLYPYNFLAPNGRVLNAGPNTDAQYIDTTGQQPNAILAHSSRYRDEGSAAMYADGKILLTGGSVTQAAAPTDTVELIDLNVANPQWRVPAGRMSFPRKFGTASILADGTVLLTNGTRSGGFNVDNGGAVLEADLWNPATETWTAMAPMDVRRIYHSTAVLMRDGRVFVAGGGQPAPTHGVDNRNAQIFSPPYLFKGPRPSISSAPSTVGYGQSFAVSTPDSASVAAINWIRLPSVTHTFDQNQRLNRLTFTRGNGVLNVAAPSNRNLAPPGHYMLFLIGSNGVPSVASIVRLADTLAITAPPPGITIPVSGVTFSWTQVAGATGYGLRITSGGNTIFDGNLAGESSNSTLISLPSGSYQFSVRSCQGGFSEAQCGAFASVSFNVSLPAPTGAPAITFPAQGQVLTQSTNTISWTPVQGASLYELLLRDEQRNKDELAIGTSDTNTVYTMPGSSNLSVRVRACSSACGPYSAPRTFSVSLPPAPTGVPSGLGCTVQSGNQLQCSWNPVGNADFYVIQVVQPTAGPGGGALTVAARQISQTSTTMSVPKGSAGVFVQACNGNGCGSYTAPFNVNPPGPNPAQPVIGQPIPGSKVDGPTVFLSWTRQEADNGSNTNYQLYVQDFSRGAPALNVLTRSNFHAGFFKAGGTRYDAIVIAAPGPGQQTSAPSGFVVHGTNANAPTMTVPRHQTAAVTAGIPAGNVVLGWTPVPGATLYEYFVALQGSPVGAASGVTPGLTVFVPLAANATKYSGIVRAFVPGVGWGPWSNAPGGPGVTDFRVQ